MGVLVGWEMAWQRGGQLQVPDVLVLLRGGLWLAVVFRLAGKRVAVIMSGCGVFDGTEVTEAVAVLVALTRNGATPVAFAPDISQVHMIDHAAGERILAPPLSVRSVVSESARITRGAVQKLADLNVDDFDALIFPGGFGVAKNL